MKCSPLLVILVALAAPWSSAQTTTWTPDKEHSAVNFSVVHMTLSNVRGRFGNIGGIVTWNDADIVKSSLKITADASSVDTGVRSESLLCSVARKVG